MEIETVTKYVCPICKREYSTYEEAYACYQQGNVDFYPEDCRPAINERLLIIQGNLVYVGRVTSVGYNAKHLFTVELTAPSGKAVSLVWKHNNRVTRLLRLTPVEEIWNIVAQLSRNNTENFTVCL